LVGMDALGGEDVLGKPLDQPASALPRRRRPVGQRRYIEVNTLLGIDLAPPVERQVRAVFDPTALAPRTYRRGRGRRGAAAPATA
jgi:hypothetical protein